VKRLFLAVDIDESTREAIAHVSAGLRVRAEARRVTWVHPDRMHLTLHFMADADDELERRMLGALAQPIPMAPFNLSFNGLGVFPSSGPPRVLWLGIGAGLQDLHRVHDMIQQGLGVAGRPAERFTPHLTLARFRDRVPRRQIAEIAAIPASAGPCRIDRVTLYESRLSPAGPSYVPLGEAPLKP
jgi:2'-5' RNA ligase